MAERIHNFHIDGDTRPVRHCLYCCDDGVVFVGLDGRTGTDQGAPCPACELGFRAEFGAKEAGSGKRPWGVEGYWRGRPWTGLDKTCFCHVQRDPNAADKMRALMSSIGKTIEI